MNKLLFWLILLGMGAIFSAAIKIYPPECDGAAPDNWFALNKVPSADLASVDGAIPTNVAVAGVGMIHESDREVYNPVPSTDPEDGPCPAGEFCRRLNFSIPAGATITKAYAYWHAGIRRDKTEDLTAKIRQDTGETENLTGQKLTTLFWPYYSTKGESAISVRAEIPNHFIKTGENSWLVYDIDILPSRYMENSTAPSAVDNLVVLNGFGILVFYREKDAVAGAEPEIFLFNGGKFAFWGGLTNTDPLYRRCFGATEDVVADFDAANEIRQARVILHVASIAGKVSGGGVRPNDVLTAVGNSVGGAEHVLKETAQASRCELCPANCYFPLNSRNKDEWDVYDKFVEIPPNATWLKVRPESSFTWLGTQDQAVLDEYSAYVNRTENGCFGSPASLYWVAAVMIVPKSQACETLPLSIDITGGQPLAGEP